jgi:hypothetical protein
MEVPGFDGLTCGVAVDYGRAVNNQTRCEEVEAIGAFCGCRPICTICPNGSPIGNPETLLYEAGEQSFPCSYLQEVMLESEDNCAYFRSDERSLSYPFWCGCEGVDAPDVCSLCADGEQVTDPDMEIPGFDGLTCGVAVDYGRAVNNQTRCEEVEAIGAFCGCEVKPSQAPSSASIEDASVRSEVKLSQAPSSASIEDASVPTQAPSSAHSFFVSKTTSALFMMGTLVMLLA